MTPESTERFWSKVDRSAGPNQCWPWTGARFELGYGAFKDRGRQYHSNRIALEQWLGKPLGDALALHTCDNPPCCNPAHLYAGTVQDNARDRVIRGRQAYGDRVPYLRRPRGSKHPDAVLTEQSVAEIRAALREGVSLGVLAARYGVVKSTIAFIAKRRTWKHVA